MTNSENAALRLRSHANLPGGVADIQGIGKILRLWRNSGGALNFDAALLEILTCLQIVNIASQTSGPVKFSTPVSRDIAYSVSCILSDLAETIGTVAARQQLHVLEQLSNALMIATHTWSQFLSGDIGDLLQDLRDNGFRIRC